MGKEIANEDYNLKITNTAPGAAVPDGSSGVTTGLFNMNGKKVIVDKVSWSPSGCTLAAHTFVSGNSAGVAATAVCVKSDGKAVTRKGDLGVCVGSFTLTAPPNTPMPCACNLEIDNAGQTDAKGE